MRLRLIAIAVQQKRLMEQSELMKIPSSKHQITNKSQVPILNDQNGFGILSNPYEPNSAKNFFSPRGPCHNSSSRPSLAKAGREPGSRKSPIILNFHWIPDLVRLRGLVRNDEFGELWHSFLGERRFLRS